MAAFTYGGHLLGTYIAQCVSLETTVAHELPEAKIGSILKAGNN
jgi:hypothetical protein